MAATRIDQGGSFCFRYGPVLSPTIRDGAWRRSVGRFRQSLDRRRLRRRWPPSPPPPQSPQSPQSSPFSLSRQTPQMPQALQSSKSSQSSRPSQAGSRNREPAPSFPPTSGLPGNGPTDGRKPQASAQASPGEGAGPSPGSLSPSSQGNGPAATAAYLSLIRAELVRRRHYPERARAQELEGTPVVVFSLDLSGRPFRPEVRGQAHPLLIRAALELLEGPPFPPPPVGWQEAFRIEVPVVYRLR